MQDSRAYLRQEGKNVTLRYVIEKSICKALHGTDNYFAPKVGLENASVTPHEDQRLKTWGDKAGVGRIFPFVWQAKV